MRVVSVFPLDEFRLALKKVYGAAAPKGPFTALSQATLFFSQNNIAVISKINCSLSVRRKRCKNVLIRLAVKARGSEV